MEDDIFTAEIKIIKNMAIQKHDMWIVNECDNFLNRSHSHTPERQFIVIDIEKLRKAIEFGWSEKQSCVTACLRYNMNCKTASDDEDEKKFAKDEISNMMPFYMENEFKYEGEKHDVK